MSDFAAVNMEQDSQDHLLSPQELSDLVISALYDIWFAALPTGNGRESRERDEPCGECGQAIGAREEDRFLLVQARRIRKAAAELKATKS